MFSLVGQCDLEMNVRGDEVIDRAEAGGADGADAASAVSEFRCTTHQV